MAYLNMSSPLVRLGGWHFLARGALALGRRLTQMTEMRSRRDQIERLTALSDAQLRARGLRRDQIVAHVFRDRLGF